MFKESYKVINKLLKENHLVITKKAKKIFSFKYPKFFILILLMALAYYFFSLPGSSKWVSYFENMGYFGVLISGILTPLGFTAPFGFGLLIKINPKSIILASLIAGVGALLGDLLIFNTIKLSFMDELKKIKRTPVIKEIKKIFKKYHHVKIINYMMYLSAGIIIASPLPDEIGVSMIAGLTTIKQIKFALISFFIHSLTFFLIFSFL